MLIIEIKRHTLNTISNDIKNIMIDNAKFLERFNDYILIVLTDIVLKKYDIFDMLYTNEEHLILDLTPLSLIAKNRLISNFDKDYPEIAFMIMGSGNNSHLLKIKEGSV